MDRTVREHLDDLQRKILSLNARVMIETNLEKRNELETELRAVQSVIEFYHSALEVENRLTPKLAG